MAEKEDEPEKIEGEEGSGNVFADLGLENADELYSRAQLGFHVFQIIHSRKPKQPEIAALLGTRQPEVSHLINGHFRRFTSDKLLEFLKRLNHKVTIRISPHKPGEPFQEVGFGLRGRASVSRKSELAPNSTFIIDRLRML